MRRLNAPLSATNTSTQSKNNLSGKKTTRSGGKFVEGNASVNESGDPIKKRKKNTKMVPWRTMNGKLVSIKHTTLRDIRRLQNTNKLLIPKLAFSRLVREIIQSNESGKYLRFASRAMQCLQEATEVQLSLWFTKLNYYAGHAKRNTVTVPDSNLNFMIQLIEPSM